MITCKYPSVKRVAFKLFFCFMIFMVCGFLTGCSQKQENLALENTPWGITVEEVLDIYEVDHSSITNLVENDYQTAFSIENGYKIFGEKTSQITFNFVDPFLSGNPDNPQKLCTIKITYPEDADMEKVLKKMKKNFGKTKPGMKLYNTGFVPTYEEVETKEDLAYWAEKPLKEAIPEEQSEEYEKKWERYERELSMESWEDFVQESYLTTAVFAKGENALPMFEKYGIYLDAYNLFVYDAIKVQMKDEQ